MNLICGINPVMEALTAGSRHFDRLLVVKGIRNQRVSEAIARASRPGDHVLVMSNGGFGGIHTMLLDALKR